MLHDFIPVGYALGISFTSLLLLQYLLISRRTDLSGEALLPRQLTIIGVFLLSVIVIIVMLPIPESTRNQILGLVGIMISGVLAFSSTAFVTNVMAAIMLRVTQPFAVGDFITFDGKFGKVSERGLFDTEIQTDTGELIAIPNALFISQAVQVVHNDGMIISTSLSLGYDVHHARIEELLISAAKQTGLRDPYVHILELGDFSVSYRVSGLLEEPKTLLTSRSRLNAKVLDTLHGAGIEIMSPNFARHISHSPDKLLIPVNPRKGETNSKSSAEEVAFAKANQAEAEAQKKSEVIDSIEAVKVELESAKGDAVTPLKEKLSRLNSELELLQGQAKDKDKVKDEAESK